MMRIPIVIIFLLTTLVGVSGQAPNVIVVLADDIGLGDISYYRKAHSQNIIVETPNIDKLAQEGMVFTNAHSPAALCAPSRYAIMTGSNTYRSRAPWGVWGSYEESPIEQNQLTLGKQMKQAGYNTAFFGKWHIGGDFLRKDDPSQIYRGWRGQIEDEVDITKYVGGGPKFQGFDYDFTFPAGIQDVPYAVYENAQWYPLKEDSEIGLILQEDMDKIGVKLDKSEGLGDLNWDPHDMSPLLANKAVDYINTYSKEEKPFFMYYCSEAVHLPHTPPNVLNGVNVKGSTPTKHLDMVASLDQQVAMMVSALKEQGVYENTVFIFTSDNGGLGSSNHTGHRTSDIYRGAKNQVYEGGHRVPFIVAWPDRVESNSSSDELIHAADIMATLSAITKKQLDQDQAMDSHNILPILLSEDNAVGHEYLLVQGGTAKEVSLHQGDWKLIIQIDKNDQTNKIRSPKALFNLKDNPEEKDALNLIGKSEHSERVAQMFAKYNEVRDSGERTTVLPEFSEDDDSVTDIEGKFNSVISIYPNPSSSKLFIEGVDKKFSIEIYDAKGVLIMKQKNEKEISIDNLPSGNYRIRLIHKGAIYTSSIVRH